MMRELIDAAALCPPSGVEPRRAGGAGEFLPDEAPAHRPARNERCGADISLQVGKLVSLLLCWFLQLVRSVPLSSVIHMANDFVQSANV